MRWVGVLARLVVGGVWLYAGLAKLPHPETSVASVRDYQLLPTDLAETVGRVLPMLEIVVGACLVLGLLVRFIGGVSALMQVAFDCVRLKISIHSLASNLTGSSSARVNWVQRVAERYQSGARRVVEEMGAASFILGLAGTSLG